MRAAARSLRDAILASETHTSVDGSVSGTGYDVIQFAPGLSGTIDLTLVGDNSFGPSAFLINDILTIQGPTTGPGITIQRDPQAPAFRLFNVAIGASLTLANLTLSGGLAQGANGTSGSGGGGGGAGLGGAIFSQGTVTVVASTLVNNEALGGNGGSSTGGNTTTGGNGGGPIPAATPPAGGNGGYGGGGGGGLGGLQHGNGGGYGGFGAGGGGGGTGNNGNAQGPGSGGAGGPGGQGGFGGGGGGGGWCWGQGAAGGFGGGSGAHASWTYVGGGGGGGGMGGAIFNDVGFLALTNSTIVDNTAQGGLGGNSPGMTNPQPMPGQDGAGFGAGVFNRDGAVTIADCTFAFNTVGGGQFDGSDIISLGSEGQVFAGVSRTTTASLTLNNTIAAYPVGGVNDVVGLAINGGTSSTAGANNLIITSSGFTGGVISTDDPLLAPLGSYGGPTQTMGLLTGSPGLARAKPALG